MQEQQNVQLEYDQNTPPSNFLKIQNHQPFYELDEVSAKKLPSQGLVIRYDPQNQFIAIGCKNGTRLLYSIEQNKFVHRYNCIDQNSVTTLKWRPMVNTNSKVLATADSQGGFQYWHIPTMKKLFFMRQNNNTINTIDFSKTGTEFATAGKDCNIRIYDQQTKSQSKILKKADWNRNGHDNRIFAIKFIDQNTLISGGWDSNVHIWDLRQGNSVKHFYGANISGQSLDFQDGNILTGCYAAKDQIKIWSLNKGKIIQTIDWTHNIKDAAYIYAASYCPFDTGVIGAGSTGAECSVKILKDIKNNGQHKLINEIQGVNQSCFSLDFSLKNSQLAFTTAHRGFYIYNMNKIK